MATEETTIKTISGHYALIAIDLRHTLTRNGRIDMSKVCTKCRESKEAKDFYKLTKSPDGLQTWCKVCMNENYDKNKNKRLHQGPSIFRNDKVCCDCNTRKPINQFHVKRGHSADGYGSYCKPCWLKRTVQSQNRAKARKLAK